MQLIYMAPVPWDSFAQRPHKFVEWFHRHTGNEVLWIDPYPTRFPKFSDILRLGKETHRQRYANPQWLRVIKPTAFPIEPLPDLLCEQFAVVAVASDLEAFVERKETMQAFESRCSSTCRSESFSPGVVPFMMRWTISPPLFRTLASAMQIAKKNWESSNVALGFLDRVEAALVRLPGRRATRAKRAGSGVLPP
jgi:hypothetical protein